MSKKNQSETSAEQTAESAAIPSNTNAPSGDVRSSADPSEVSTLRDQVRALEERLAESDALKAQVKSLEGQLAEAGKSFRAKVAAAQAGAGLQPNPSLVRPGLVWDHEKNTAVPYKAGPAGRFRVEAPNEGFNGDKAGVKFINGVGYTDDEQLGEWFANTLRYDVTDTQDPRNG